MAARDYGQYCGVASALELVGERWALLIVRDLLVGPRRYTDLKAGLPRIPTNILSTRLKELQEGGVIRRAPLLRSIVYELTDVGRELEDVVLALGRWGFKAMGEPGVDDVITSDSMTMDLRATFRADAAATFPPTRYRARITGVDLVLHVDDAALRVSPPTPDDALPDLHFAAGADIHAVMAGDVTADAAIEQGIVRILDGNPALLGRFVTTFGLAPQAVPF